MPNYIKFWLQNLSLRKRFLYAVAQGRPEAKTRLQARLGNRGRTHRLALVKTGVRPYNDDEWAAVRLNSW